jgi:WD40 repeat protein
LSISADSRRLLAGERNGCLLWELETGRLLRVLGSRGSASFDRAGTYLLVDADPQLEVWDSSAEHCVLRIDTNEKQVIGTVFCADGESILVLFESECRWIRIKTGEVLRAFDIPFGDPQSTDRLVAELDNRVPQTERQIDTPDDIDALGNGQSYLLRYPAHWPRLPHTFTWPVAGSPDGKRFVLGTPDGVHLYDLELSIPLRVTPLPNREVPTAISWSPDSQTYAVAACSFAAVDSGTPSQFSACKVRVFDGASGEIIVQCQGDGAHDVHNELSGNRVIGGYGSCWTVWDRSSGEVLYEERADEEKPWSLRQETSLVVPNSNMILVAGDNLVLWTRMMPERWLSPARRIYFGVVVACGALLVWNLTAAVRRKLRTRAESKELSLAG